MKKGSVFGGMLLITGSCIGAGMLGMPILTGLAGFFPAMLMFFIAWAFMTATSFLLVEVNQQLGDRVNLLTMVEKRLGKWPRIITWFLYLFLFYSLLFAYLADMGTIFSTFFRVYFRIAIPDWIGSFFFVFVFGWIVYLGTRTADLWNRFLMLGKIVCFIGLLLLGAKFMEFPLLTRTDFSLAPLALPLLITSFGFHNMVPSLVNYLGGDLPRIRKTIFAGSLFTLLLYLIWEILVLAILPYKGNYGILANLSRGQDAAQAIVQLLGLSWVGSFAQGLAFFAILTSFLAQTLGLVHFWSDGLRVKWGERENPWICLLALFPPLILSMLKPGLFYQALGFAGGFCAVIIFGVFPVWMVWKERRKNKQIPYRVAGGNLLLAVLLFIALFIFFFQISTMLGISYLPDIQMGL